MRLIDADAIQFEIVTDENNNQFLHVWKEDIDKAPTIDPESLWPVGKWVNASGGRTICKRCGNYPLYDYWGKQKLSRFCPECGVRMEE